MSEEKRIYPEGISTFKVPIDKEGYMNAPQKFASALTFAKRYAFCNAFGILTGDEDDDSNAVEQVKKDIKDNKNFYYEKKGDAPKPNPDVKPAPKTQSSPLVIVYTAR